MPEFNRRRFLIAGAGVGAVGLLSGAVAVGWDDLLRAAHERPLADNAGVLVIVTLYGGNDGHQHRDSLRRQRISRCPSRTGLRPGRCLAPRRPARTQPRDARAGSAVEPAATRDCAGRELSQTRSQPLPVHGYLADRLAGRTRVDGLDRPLARRHRRRPAARGQHRRRAASAGRGRKAHGGSAFDNHVARRARRQGRRFQTTIQALGVDDPDDTPAMAAVRRSYRAARTTDATFASITANDDENNAWPPG